jgi:hypothetical protein
VDGVSLAVLAGHLAARSLFTKIKGVIVGAKVPAICSPQGSGFLIAARP